jgi:hypothetical protein
MKTGLQKFSNDGRSRQSRINHPNIVKIPPFLPFLNSFILSRLQKLSGLFLPIPLTILFSSLPPAPLEEKVRFIPLNLANHAGDEHSTLAQKHPASAYKGLAALR